MRSSAPSTTVTRSAGAPRPPKVAFTVSLCDRLATICASHARLYGVAPPGTSNAMSAVPSEPEPPNANSITLSRNTGNTSVQNSDERLRR